MSAVRRMRLLKLQQLDKLSIDCTKKRFRRPKLGRKTAEDEVAEKKMEPDLFV
jgi:hypothetical protein